ncbi:hypothetical protein BJV82DRAFT_702468 [Fennellomyces sp. T-0311]|nr:hypothetical protein BJV82DRAFT_702468 [Fennellomyces sp. T-0311]
MTNPKYINSTRKYLESQCNDASEVPTYSTVPGMDEDIIMENNDPSAATAGDHGEQLSSSVLDDGFDEYDYGDNYYRETVTNHNDEDISETGTNCDGEDTYEIARSIHHVNAANANSTERMDDEDDIASVDSHVDPVASRTIPVDSHSEVDDDDSDDDAENIIDDDSTPHRRVVDDSPLGYTFKEYPHIGRDARMRKSCELYCLVQEQNITRDTYHALIKMFNGWIKMMS